MQTQEDFSYFREPFNWMRKSADIETIKMQKSPVPLYKIKWYVIQGCWGVELVPKQEGNWNTQPKEKVKEKKKECNQIYR